MSRLSRYLTGVANRCRQPVALARLPRGRRSAVVSAVVALVLTNSVVHLFSLRRARTILEAVRDRPPRRIEGSADHSAVVWAIERSGEALPGSTCLTKTLGAQLLLERRGRSTTVHIGVTRRDGELAAHSWLECDGDVLIGDDVDLDEFRELPRIDDHL